MQVLASGQQGNHLQKSSIRRGRQHFLAPSLRRVLDKISPVMPNSPFRTAFWALSLAMVLIISLTVANPRALRSFSNPNLASTADPGHHSESPSDQVFARPTQNTDSGSLASPEHVSALTSEGDRPPGVTPGVLPEPTSPYASTPIRVALADPSRSLGLEASAVPMSTVQTPHSDSWNRSESEQPLSIPVPVPEELANQSEPNARSEFQMLQQELQHLRIAVIQEELARIRQEQPQTAVPEVQAELSLIRTNLTDVNTTVERIEDTVGSHDVRLAEILTHIQPTATEPEPSQPAPVEPTYRVQPGETSQRWTFEFQQTPLPEVFQLLGDQLGWNVVWSGKIEGAFTGNFSNADPEQVFAIVLKSSGCSVDYRGNYVMVHPPSR